MNDSRDSRRSGRGPSSGRRARGPEPKRAPPPLTGRQLAYQAIDAYERRGTFASQTLDRLFVAGHIDVAERRLATELAFGTIRRRETLDAVLSAYCSRPLEELDVQVKLVLRLGLNQILFVSRIPPHAAVDESVRMCRELMKLAATSMVNGVLRTILRELEQGAVPVHSFADCAADLLVRSPTDGTGPLEGVRLGRQIAPDPRLQPAVYLSAVTSLPVWLIRHWQPRFSNDEILRMGLWFDTPGSMSVRVNLLQTTRDQMLNVLQSSGVQCLAGDLPEAIRPDRTFAVEEIPGFAEGWFSIQDETAMQAVNLLNPQPGERILDMCAAPGGKSTHIAERLRDQGEVVACDIVPERLVYVAQSAMRLRLKSIKTYTTDARGRQIPPGPYDGVLVDVPCSNTGVLGKRPEARWRLEQNSLTELIPVQRHLLTQALELVRPGGRVVYSTCSIEPEENEQAIRAVLDEMPHCRLVEQHRNLPGQPADGGYRALLVKQSS